MLHSARNSIYYSFYILPRAILHLFVYLHWIITYRKRLIYFHNYYDLSALIYYPFV